MRRLPFLAVLLAVTVLGCGDSTVPGTPGVDEPSPSIDAGESESAPIPEPSSAPIDQIVGPWRPDAIDLGDRQVAIISDACAAAARETLGEDEASLPTALVDARGEGYATAILADDLSAIECQARTDGRTATVDLVSRLSPTAVAAVDDAQVTVARLVNEEDRDGGRTVAFGRVGPVPIQVKLGLDDKSEVVASRGDDWWAAWWPGTARASAIVGVDRQGLVVGTAVAPNKEVEARVGPAWWWIDPKAALPTAGSMTIHALVLERACASGQSSEGRVEPPVIEVTDTAITVTYAVRHRPGGQDCQGHPPSAIELKLPEPLGNRVLLDGSETPPRDAKIPAG